MKHKLQFLTGTVVPALILSLTVLFSLNAFGCSSNPEGLTNLSGDFSVPKIQSFSVTSESSLELNFTDAVESVKAEVFSGEKTYETSVSLNGEKTSASITFSEPAQTGASCVVEGEVLDRAGNSLTFSLPFKGYNSNPARLVISEVRNAYGAVTANKVTTHRSEFVELVAVKEGNLSGLELFSAGDGEERRYEFPAVNVSRGEYITVHVRKPPVNEKYPEDAEGMTCELSDDLTLSTHTDSCNTARDLWAENEKACFADSDIIVLRNSWSGKIEDCVLFAKSTLEQWPEPYGKTLSSVLEEGLWQNADGTASCEPESALCADNVTSSAATRSFSRQNVGELLEVSESGIDENVPFKNSKEVWILTCDSGSGSKKITGVTPGYENSDNAYVSK